MKKMIGIVAAIVAACGIVYGGSVTTTALTENQATPNGLQSLKNTINDNFTAVGTAIGKTVTNVTITAVAPVTNVVLQTTVPTFILADGTTNTMAFPTNIVIQRGAASTLTIQR